ncbi:MAG: hypothetical protein HC866_08140 [Leptolyngbyaceae cyanobacterium RU_5_1]|nr:hypothetical protein [Leptolyngbyaceae cyanobacterium RU_5_1]
MSKPVFSPTDRISQVIDRLRALSQISIQTGWRYCDRDLPHEQALDPSTWNTWTIGTLNAKDHLPWLKGGEVCWFSQTIVVPPDLNGYPLEGLTLRLALLWWAQEAQLFVDGQLVQEGDLFDCAPRLRLSPSAKPGDEMAIALRLVSPNHEDGALMKSVCHYEAPSSDHPPNPASSPTNSPSCTASYKPSNPTN